MTREERLSLAIARHCEPEPKWTYRGQPLGDGDVYVSDGGYWERVLGMTSYVTPLPVQITEPEIAMALLGRLFRKSGFIDVALLIFNADDRPSGISFRDWWTDERIKVAIAEQFAKAFNLEV